MTHLHLFSMIISPHSCSVWTHGRKYIQVVRYTPICKSSIAIEPVTRFHVCLLILAITVVDPAESGSATELQQLAFVLLLSALCYR